MSALALHVSFARLRVSHEVCEDSLICLVCFLEGGVLGTLEPLNRAVGGPRVFRFDADAGWPRAIGADGNASVPLLSATCARGVIQVDNVLGSVLGRASLRIVRHFGFDNRRGELNLSLRSQL